MQAPVLILKDFYAWEPLGHVDQMFSNHQAPGSSTLSRELGVDATIRFER
jgi:hypothetical protein